MLFPLLNEKRIAKKQFVLSIAVLTSDYSSNFFCHIFYVLNLVVEFVHQYRKDDCQYEIEKRERQNDVSAVNESEPFARVNRFGDGEQSDEINDSKQGVTLDKPNKVGTLTNKKADAWLSVLLDEAEKRQEAQKAADDRKAAFMERMAKLTKKPASTFEKGGSLYLGMFLVKWEYCQDGRAYTRIEINPCSKNEKGEYMNDTERLSVLADCGLLG